MNLTDQLCATLHHDRDEIVRLAAEKASARLGFTVPDQRLREELAVCIDVLAVAVDLGTPNLFANHLTWTLPALHGADGFDIVESELTALRQTLLAELPIDILGLTAVYLVAAAQSLRNASEARKRWVRQRQQRWPALGAAAAVAIAA